MKALTVFLLSAIWCQSQPMPKPVGFAWDAPTDISDVIGYEFQWGPQDASQAPLHQTVYTVPNFPLDFNRSVSVSSVGLSTNSEPITINVYNLVAYLEETEDFKDWNVIKSVQLTGERKPQSFLRVRLDAQ